MAGAAGVCMVRYSDHTLYGGSEHDITNSNGRNIAIVTGSALGLGYGLTKRLIADGWFVAGIDTAFYRDSRDYVSEEKQHTFMDPGELARVILFNLVNDANLTVSDILIERNYR